MTPARAAACTPSPAAVVRRLRIVLGTTVAVCAEAASKEQATAAVRAAFAAVARVDERLRPEGVHSDLSRLSTAPPGTAVPLWRGTFELLRFAQQLNRASGGIFDPCLPQRAGRLADIELLDGTCCRGVAHAPLALDCGGIAKGFAIDQAVAALQAAGCRAGLVNAGGDLRVFGRPQLILLRRVAHLEPLELSEAALAVSDRDAGRAPPGHRGYYVRGAALTQQERYVAVRAPQAMCADALTKCVLLCPAGVSTALLQQFAAERLA